MLSKNKTKQAYRLIRKLAGGHKSIKIELLPNANYPVLEGNPWDVVVDKEKVRFYSNNGSRTMYAKIRYIKSTQKVKVGEKFLSKLSKITFKKTGEHKFIIDDVEVSIPNTTVGVFLMRSVPKDFRYRDIKII